jgi:hypothetical protein
LREHFLDVTFWEGELLMFVDLRFYGFTTMKHVWSDFFSNAVCGLCGVIIEFAVGIWGYVGTFRRLFRLC